MLEFIRTPELKTPFTDCAGVVLRPVGDDDLTDLQAILKKHQIADPYQSSAAYYALTGRNGLWLVQEGDAAVMVCRHPNVSGEFLVFPQIGKCSSNLLAKTISAISKTGVNVSVARADEFQSRRLVASHPNIQLEKVPEQILDWAYPVHVLDTAKVVQHSGNEFQQFRTKLNKVDQTLIQAFDLDLTIHRQAVSDIVLKWAEGDQEKITPYMRLLDLFEKVPMAGRIILHNGQPAGFSLWEETFPKSGLANAYAHLGLHEIKGMARYVMLDMCKALHKKGYSKVCIGGSETAGLDQFKRQLRPVRSISLGSSLKFVPAESAMTKQSLAFAQPYQT